MNVKNTLKKPLENLTRFCVIIFFKLICITLIALYYILYVSGNQHDEKYELPNILVMTLVLHHQNLKLSL